MKIKEYKNTWSIPALLIIILLSGNLIVTSAQAPTHYPSAGEPVEFTFINILLYLVVPVLFVFLYLWFRRYKAKQKQNEKDN